jgi:hypothetical protein
VFFDGFEIFLEDAKPISKFFRRDVNHVSKLVSPFLEQFRSALFLPILVEEQEGGEGEGECKHSKFVHVKI